VFLLENTVNSSAGGDFVRVSIAILDTGVAPVDDLGFRGSRILACVDFVNNRNHPYDEACEICRLITNQYHI